MKMYHSTSRAGRKGILRDGLKTGQSITSFRQNDDGGYAKAGGWADEYYGTHPVYLAIQQGLYSQLARQLGLEFEVEVDQNMLVADLPSLVDTGAYIESDGVYWEYDDVPSAMKPVTDGDGWIAFEELLRPGSVAANAAINTTGTAASLNDIPQERVAQLTNESIIREYVRDVLTEGARVLGYIKPASSFFTLAEWEEAANGFLSLQSEGVDTRGGVLSPDPRLAVLIQTYFDYQLNVEVERYDLLTEKNVLDFIEDFVNHRFWGFASEFGQYFPDISKLRFAYFYSRGDMEPYVLLDDEYTTQLYGSTNNPKELLHYTDVGGVATLETSIASGESFDISTFTVAERPFFRSESNLIVKLIGNVKAGFRSDIKSLAVDNGRRACNMHRLEYPGHDVNNICYELDSCSGEVRTSLWNEYIATPLKILEIKEGYGEVTWK